MNPYLAIAAFGSVALGFLVLYLGEKDRGKKKAKKRSK